MDAQPLNFKSMQSSTPLKGSSLDLMYFKKLYEALKELHEEAVEIELNTIIIRPTDSKEIVDRFKLDIKNNFTLTIQIFGVMGEYHYSENGAILEETKLPNNIKMMAFDNSMRLNNQFKKFTKKLF